MAKTRQWRPVPFTPQPSPVVAAPAPPPPAPPLPPLLAAALDAAAPSPAVGTEPPALTSRARFLPRPTSPSRPPPSPLPPASRPPPSACSTAPAFSAACNGMPREPPRRKASSTGTLKPPSTGGAAATAEAASGVPLPLVFVCAHASQHVDGLFHLTSCIERVREGDLQLLPSRQTAAGTGAAGIGPPAGQPAVRAGTGAVAGAASRRCCRHTEAGSSIWCVW